MSLGANKAPTPRWLRGQALIGAVLALALFIVGARLAERHLRLRADLSEDGMLSFSPATDLILGRLEDVAQLEMFVTAEIENGAGQLARTRLMEQLSELEERSGGQLQVILRDPASSSQARLEALDYGIPYENIARGGSGVLIAQEVFMGGVLRYRGGERVLPRLYPDALEYVLLSSLHALMQPRPMRVGWYVGGDDPQDFSVARDLLARRVEIMPVGGLAEGRPVPDVDVLILVRPVDLHPRAAFEVDQFVQRGGALLALVDRSAGNIAERRFEAIDSGLEDVLESWGVFVSRAHLWDQLGHRAMQIGEVNPNTGEVVNYVRVPNPMWINILPEGLDSSHPSTARLPGLALTWAHPIEPGEAPPGAERIELAHTSDRTFLVPLEPEMELDNDSIRLRDTNFLAAGGEASYPVIVALTGPLPSAFADLGRPPARDAFTGEDRVGEAGTGANAAPVLSGEGDSRVVVVGDADFLAARGRDLRVDPVSQLFLENIVDWLGAAPELLALRSKLPRDRSITDFVAEEFRAAGLSSVRGNVGRSEAQGPNANESSAIERADRRRRLHVGATVGGSAAAALVLALAAALRRRLRLTALGRTVGEGGGA
ncbi:GldG family protein [Engelhardtia mirabilis]|uniref:ABC-type uncharacterized transport system n=1 Tax=Engelhardtia mirabilis TaxID=2528011 RepID=A0A518BJ79_9BACT|nr:ABC-type uncharacterized transport system [Planctomycetes bacterium Pla133]QDV01357.1 ABC-type uncharacterized transport system [Planctomycetes bacterium Pla86]